MPQWLPIILTIKTEVSPLSYKIPTWSSLCLLLPISVPPTLSPGCFTLATLRWWVVEG